MGTFFEAERLDDEDSMSYCGGGSKFESIEQEKAYWGRQLVAYSTELAEWPEREAEALRALEKAHEAIAAEKADIKARPFAVGCEFFASRADAEKSEYARKGVRVRRFDADGYLRGRVEAAENTLAGLRRFGPEYLAKEIENIRDRLEKLDGVMR